jgi:hypothetical protein
MSKKLVYFDWAMKKLLRTKPLWVFWKAPTVHRVRLQPPSTDNFQANLKICCNRVLRGGFSNSRNNRGTALTYSRKASLYSGLLFAFYYLCYKGLHNEQKTDSL